MATFEGTSKEFKRFIGPRLRNVVNYITKKHRKAAGACENCGSTESLHAAHVRGRDRTTIIDLLLGDAPPGNRTIKVDLDRFDKEFRFEHEPFEKAFLILCMKCHREYDAPVVSSTPHSTRAGKSDERTSLSTSVCSDILPITFDPQGAVAFKQALLIAKAAEMSVFFADKKTEVRHWDASNFSESSNLLGNLRSRQDLRQGEWQLHGIVKVHVRILTDAGPVD